MTSVKEIKSVRNVCAVLEAVAQHQPIGVSDLARITGIDKSGAHRLAVTLSGATGALLAGLIASLWSVPVTMLAAGLLLMTMLAILGPALHRKLAVIPGC